MILKYDMKIIYVLILIAFNSNLFSQLEIPSLGESDSIIHHSAYSLSFNSDYLQANWVAYLLTRAEVDPLVLEGNPVKRSDNFCADPLVPETDLSSDYYKSNYDRGHLAPAGDMGFSKTAMDESFITRICLHKWLVLIEGFGRN